MLTALANISTKRTLYSVTNCKVPKTNGLNPFNYSFHYYFVLFEICKEVNGCIFVTIVMFTFDLQNIKMKIETKFNFKTKSY